jgi:predicted nucleic-acid-binding protein
MKIAIDTHVLVRYIVWDDERQARNANRVIKSAEVISVSIIVLCEVVWVLRRAYRYSSEDVANVIAGLIQSRNVQVDLPADETGLRRFRDLR